MTAAEIIAANPAFAYEPATIGGMAGLKGRDPETDAEVWCVFSATSHVAAAGPWTAEEIRAAATNLAGAEAYVDRGHYLTRPTNEGPES